MKSILFNYNQQLPVCSPNLPFMQQEYHEQPWQSALLIMARMLWALDLQIASLTDVGMGAGVNWSFNLNTDYMG